MAKFKKIIDNPSQSELLKQVNVFQTLEKIYKRVPFSRKLFPKIGDTFDKFDEIKKQLTILEAPDQFNERFSNLGWIAYESMRLDIIQKSIDIYETDGQSKAEDFLTDSYDETTLNQGILGLKGNNHFQKRIRLIELAKDDYLSNRYHACIPLLLSLIDGLVNDVSKHVGFFANNVDLTAWDCIAAHESGLQALTSLLNKGRNKTNEDAISIPYRNGILHGRELNFDNKIVAAKCWATLFAIKDWAEAIDSGKKEPQPKDDITWTQLLEKISKTELTKKSIEEWRPRSSNELIYLPFEGDITKLPENTPEYVVAIFIDHWCNKRFGLMANILSHFVDYPQGKKSGLARQDFGRYIPISFKILDIDDQAAAATNIATELCFNIDGEKKYKKISIRIIYFDSDNQVSVRSISGGQWKIIQNSFSEIIYSVNL